MSGPALIAARAFSPSSGLPFYARQARPALGPRTAAEIPPRVFPPIRALQERRPRPRHTRGPTEAGPLDARTSTASGSPARSSVASILVLVLNPIIGLRPNTAPGHHVYRESRRGRGHCVRDVDVVARPRRSADPRPRARPPPISCRPEREVARTNRPQTRGEAGVGRAALALWRLFVCLEYSVPGSAEFGPLGLSGPLPWPWIRGCTRGVAGIRRAVLAAGSG